MASGPLKQSVALPEIVRNMTGEAATVARELKREREKLEAEIRKTLESAGAVDVKLTQKLDVLRRREIEAKYYAGKDAAAALARKDAMETRGFGRNLGDIMELSSGRINAGSLRGLSEILQDAGQKLAGKGKIRAGNMLTNLGNMVSGGVTNVVMPAAAVAGTWAAGYELGGQIGDAIWGNAQEMEQEAKRQGQLQEAIWAQRNRLGDYQTTFLLGQQSNPWTEAWLMRDSVRGGRGMFAQAERERLKMKGYWDYAGDSFKRDRGQKQDAEWITNRMRELSKAEEKKRQQYMESPSTVRDRAIANERALTLRALEEEKFNRRQDWSGF